MKNKMFKIKKRLLSITLAILMIFGMVPHIDFSEKAQAATLNYDIEKYIPIVSKYTFKNSSDDLNSYNYTSTVSIKNNNGFAVNVRGISLILKVRVYHEDGEVYDTDQKSISFSEVRPLYGTLKSISTENFKYRHYKSDKSSLIDELIYGESVDCLNISQPIEFNGVKTYAFKENNVYVKNGKLEEINKETIKLTTHKGKPGGTDGDMTKNYLYGFTIPTTMSYLVPKYSTVETKPILEKILKTFDKTDMPEFVVEKDSVEVADEPVVVKCTTKSIIGDDWSTGEKKDITTSANISIVLIPDSLGAGGSDFDSSELEAKIAELEKQIKGLTETIDKQKTDLENLKKQIPETEDEIKALQDAKAALENKISANEDLIKSLKEQLNDIAKKDAEQDEIIKDLRNKLDELTEKNEALEKELAKAKQEALEKAKEEAKSEIDKLKNLSEEDKNKAKSDIDNATDTTTVNQIFEDAKKKDADNKIAADEKAKEELAKAKEEAKTEIKSNKDLTAEQIAEYEKKIDQADSEEAVKAIVEEAKKQAETNKVSEEEKTKEEEELAKAKEKAKTEIKSNKELTAEQIAEYEKKIDQADSEEAVKAIVEEAKKQAETNKASEEEKAKQDALAKAKEEALKKAKEEELAKELAKKNENDPAYQRDKLSKLLEEAKRVRRPSEELEAAIDEAYDILFDKYARLEDYKYAIEKIERILQNRRDTRRNRFKLDVDDLNEKDTELTGKTGAKWYIDVYNGKKIILSGQANYKGDFSIEIKKGKIKAKDKLKVVATDPQDDKKYKEVEIEVGGDAKENKENKSAFDINDLLQADGSNSLSDLAVFPVGKNFYNVVQNNQKTTVYMDVTTFISGNRTMLPMRYIAYALGFNVEYDSLAREAIFSNTENSSLVKKTIRVNIDTGLMRDSDGRIYASDVRPVLINNRIHASIANIARMFNASQGTIEDGISQTIEWDNARKAVYIFKNVR